MKTWHRVIAGLGGIILLLFVVFLIWFRVAHQPSNPEDHEMRTINIHGQLIHAEVVSTQADLEQGLSDRPYMAKNRGMLFEMGYKGIHPFWMIRMHFPLDIVWLDGDKVVEIAPNLPAPGFLAVPVTYTPRAEADRVLELNAGEATNLGLKTGDSILGLY